MLYSKLKMLQKPSFAIKITKMFSGVICFLLVSHVIAFLFILEFAGLITNLYRSLWMDLR